MNKYEDAVATELKEGFDRTKAQAALDAFLRGRLGWGAYMLPSAAPGVIAMERLDWRDEEKLDWNEISDVLEKATGCTVAAIDDCDWELDDDCDAEATYFAFAIPSLSSDYADVAGAPAP